MIDLVIGYTTSQSMSHWCRNNGMRSAAAASLWTVVTPTFWAEGRDFGAASWLLSSLGGPAVPLRPE